MTDKATLFPEPARDKSAQERGATFAPKFGPDGLVTAIAVERATGAVLMVAHMDAEALAATLATGRAHYHSRSRGALWLKGETSGQIQTVEEIRVDCDQDAILLSVSVGGDGGACHTGAKSCFYRRLTPSGALERTEPDHRSDGPGPMGEDVRRR